MRAACAALLHAPAALQQELVGPQQAREATAALLGLGKLGLDPGEKFAAAIMRLVEADGGRDPGLLAFTAWTLAICEVRRWGCSWMLLQGLCCSATACGPGPRFGASRGLWCSATAYVSGPGEGTLRAILLHAGLRDM